LLVNDNFRYYFNAYIDCSFSCICAKIKEVFWDNVMEPIYLSIQPAETGKRIKQLLLEQGYTIRDIQGAFG